MSLKALIGSEVDKTKRYGHKQARPVLIHSDLLTCLLTTLSLEVDFVLLLTFLEVTFAALPSASVHK